VTIGEAGASGHRTTTPAAAEAVRPSRLSDDPWSQPSRYGRIRSETARYSAVAYRVISPRRSPLCLSDSGAASIGPLLVTAYDCAARVFEPTQRNRQTIQLRLDVSANRQVAGTAAGNKSRTALFGQILLSHSSLRRAEQTVAALLGRAWTPWRPFDSLQRKKIIGVNEALKEVFYVRSEQGR